MTLVADIEERVAERDSLYETENEVIHFYGHNPSVTEIEKNGSYGENPNFLFLRSSEQNEVKKDTPASHAMRLSFRNVDSQTAQELRRMFTELSFDEQETVKCLAARQGEEGDIVAILEYGATQADFEHSMGVLANFRDRANDLLDENGGEALITIARDQEKSISVIYEDSDHAALDFSLQGPATWAAVSALPFKKDQTPPNPNSRVQIAFVASDNNLELDDRFEDLKSQKKPNIVTTKGNIRSYIYDITSDFDAVEINEVQISLDPDQKPLVPGTMTDQEMMDFFPDFQDQLEKKGLVERIVGSSLFVKVDISGLSAFTRRGIEPGSSFLRLFKKYSKAANDFLSGMRMRFIEGDANIYSFPDKGNLDVQSLKEVVSFLDAAQRTFSEDVFHIWGSSAEDLLKIADVDDSQIGMKAVIVDLPETKYTLLPGGVLHLETPGMDEVEGKAEKRAKTGGYDACIAMQRKLSEEEHFDVFGSKDVVVEEEDGVFYYRVNTGETLLELNLEHTLWRMQATQAEESEVLDSLWYSADFARKKAVENGDVLGQISNNDIAYARILIVLDKLVESKQFGNRDQVFAKLINEESFHPNTIKTLRNLFDSNELPQDIYNAYNVMNV